MTQPLDFLVPEPHREASAWHWATVASTAPLRVKLDGAQEEVLDATPDTLVYGLATGNRVRVHISGRRAVVIGKAGGTPPPEEPLVYDWVNITTASGFSAYSTFGPLQARRTILGVQLRGTIRRTTSGTIESDQVIGQLPAGHRPTQGQYRWLPRGNQKSGLAALIFFPNGNIVIDSYSTTTFYNVALDGIIIPTD